MRADAVPAVEPVRSAGTVLHLRAGPSAFVVEQTPALVGRLTEAAVQLAPVQVSRRHAELRCDVQGHWSIVDLGSAAGSGVNGQRAQAGQAAPLKVGDRIFIADVLIEVVAIQPRARPEDAAFQTAVGREAGASALGSMHTYQVRPLGELASGDASRALEILLKLSRQLARALEIEQVLKAVATAVQKLLGGAERVALVYQRDGQPLYAWAESKTGRHHLDRPGWLSQTVANWVMSHGQVVISGNPLADQRFDAAASLHLSGARGLAAAPISDGAQTLGLLYVDTQASITYPKITQQLADLFGAIAEASQGAVERLLQTQAHRHELAMRTNLQRFLAPQVVNRLRQEGLQGQRLATRSVHASVLFADIAGFTRLSAALSPEDIAKVLNVVFDALVPVLFAYEGTLDKFIGDCVMAVFGAPDELPDHAERAVRAGLKMIEAFNDVASALVLPIKVQLRVAVHSGPLVAGEMGSEQRREYTVLGSTVNIASRIEGVGEAGTLTVSDYTRSCVSAEEFEAIETGVFPLKGITEPMTLFRIRRR